jgi:hypothetical protein
MFVYVFALFFVLTPGILVYLPPRSSLTITALTHAFIFALVMYLTCRIVYQATNDIFEGKSPMMFPVIGNARSQNISAPSPEPASAIAPTLPMR